MTNDQFLFWLWGWFELNEDDPYPLNNMQLSAIAKHIELVKEENLYTSPFIAWLDGVLDITSRLEPADEDDAYDTLTNLIYDKLKAEFERKAETIAALKDRPVDEPTNPYNVKIIPLNKTCAPMPFTDARKFCANLNAVEEAANMQEELKTNLDGPVGSC